LFKFVLILLDVALLPASVQYHKDQGINNTQQLNSLTKADNFFIAPGLIMSEVSWKFISLTCVSLLIVAANIVVCVFVLNNARLRTYTNGFIVSLAVSDILTGGVLYPIHLSGPDSAAAASEGYVIAFVLLSGVGNICLVTWDRYVAVAKPFQYRKIVKSHFVKLIIITWVTSLVIAILPLTWQTNPDVVIHKVYLFCLMGFFVVIPYAAVFYAYYKIGQQLKRHHQKIRNRSANSLSSRRVKSEAKVAKVFLAVVIIFVLSWLPIIYMTTVGIVSRPDLSPVALQTVSLFTVALSSLANPLLYAFMKEDFRREFMKRSTQRRRSSVSASAIELKKTISTACAVPLQPSLKYLQLT